MIEDKDLYTTRLALEPLAHRHARATFPDWGEPDLYRFIPQEPPESLSVLSERFRRLESRRSPDGQQVWLNWMIRLKSEGRYAGLVEISEDELGTASLAYFVFKPFWRRGIATEACLRIIEYLRDERGIHKVVAELDTRNIASIQLLTKLSFSRVGYRREADTFKGVISDEYRYERYLADAISR